MRLEVAKYISSLWSRLGAGPEREANRDLAQKLEQLARDLKAIDPFPSGVILFWLGEASSIPAGWSEVVELRGRFPRGMAEGGTPGTPGGSDTHSHSMNHSHTGAADLGGAHLHTITGVADHNHTISSQGGYQAFLQNLAGGFGSGGTFQAGNGSSYVNVTSHNHGGATGTAGSHNHSGFTGGGSVEGSHSHALTINPLAASTGSGSTLPAHLNGIWIRKD